MYVPRNCFDLSFLLLLLFLLLSFLGVGDGEGGGYLFIYLFYFIFLKFHFEISYVLLYLNSCKISIFKVVVLYCVILFWWIKQFQVKKKNIHQTTSYLDKGHWIQPHATKEGPPDNMRRTNVQQMKIGETSDMLKMKQKSHKWKNSSFTERSDAQQRDLETHTSYPNSKWKPIKADWGALFFKKLLEN